METYEPKDDAVSCAFVALVGSRRGGHYYIWCKGIYDPAHSELAGVPLKTCHPTISSKPLGNPLTGGI